MTETQDKTVVGTCMACRLDRADPGRRQILAGTLGMLAVSSLPALAQEAGRSKKPEVGDRLSFITGERKGQEIKPEDLIVGEKPILAYPLDPASNTPVSARINLLSVVRLKPGDLKPGSARNAADGIVAFSSVCTHTGCPVTSIHPSHTKIVCDCHGSIFDAADRGAVVGGPATRRLAMLPLKIEDGHLIIAGKFDGPLGPPT